jgi:probable phosphoglycerate mutase
VLVCFTEPVLILVRHGRTAANVAGRLQGRMDVPLDDTGHAQAVAVAAAVGEVDAVISSPLGRALDTAAAFGCPVEIDERWIEVDYGEFDGRRIVDVPAELWDAWRRDPAVPSPGGESLGDVDRRVRAACADLAERAVDERIVVVSHVSPIKAAVLWSLGADVALSFRCHLDPGSISRIRCAADGPLLVSFNETSYAERTGPPPGATSDPTGPAGGGVAAWRRSPH